jgi:hypothetical protein
LGVVIEELRSHFKVFGERLQGLDDVVRAGFARLDGRVDGVEGRFDGLEGRFDGLEGRFDGIEGRFNGIEGRFDGLEGRFNGLEERFDGIEARFDGIEGRFDGIEARFDGIEGRFDGLEERMTAGFAHVDERLDGLSHEVGLVKLAVLEHGRALKEKVDRNEVEAIVERAMGRRS